MKIQMTSQWESKQWKLQQKPTKKYKKNPCFFERQISPTVRCCVHNWFLIHLGTTIQSKEASERQQIWKNAEEKIVFYMNINIAEILEIV